MRKKKNAYTLIETVVVIFIIIILFTIISGIGSSIKKVKDYINARGSLLEITSVISYGKYYCRKSESQGVIRIYKKTGEVVLEEISSEYKELRRIKIPKGLRFVDNVELYINNKGQIQSNSIRILNEDGELYKITIATGVDTINIYEE